MNNTITPNKLKTNNNLRKCELKDTIVESKKVKKGKYVQESVEKHIKKIKKEYIK